MRFPNEAELKALRERYPAGTRILLIQMADDIAPVPPATTGSVAIIDDAGNIHMKWDNGRSLALIEGADELRVRGHLRRLILQPPGAAGNERTYAL